MFYKFWIITKPFKTNMNNNKNWNLFFTCGTSLSTWNTFFPFTKCPHFSTGQSKTSKNPPPPSLELYFQVSLHIYSVPFKEMQYNLEGSKSFHTFFIFALLWNLITSENWAQIYTNLFQYSREQVLLQSAAIAFLLKQASYLQQNIKIPQNNSCISPKFRRIFCHYRSMLLY